MIKCPCGQEFESHTAMGGHSRKCALCTPDARFWMKVEKSEGCWGWTGALQRDGYAHFNMNGKTVSAHRYTYEQLVGPIPEGMDLLHQCDNRACVNPYHTRPGTHEENMRDCLDRGRTTRGTRNPKAKLTEEQAVAIIAEYKRTRRNKSNVQELSAKYGVGATTIYHVACGVTWPHLDHLRTYKPS